MALSTDNYPDVGSHREVQTIVQGIDTILGSSASTPTSFGSKLILPATAFAGVGNLLRIRAWGDLTTNATPANIDIAFVYDDATVLCDTGVFTQPAGLTTKGWQAECDIVVVGSGGALEVQGILKEPSGLIVSMPNLTGVTVSVTPGTHTVGLKITYQSSKAGEYMEQRLIYVLRA